MCPKFVFLALSTNNARFEITIFDNVFLLLCRRMDAVESFDSNQAGRVDSAQGMGVTMFSGIPIIDISSSIVDSDDWDVFLDLVRGFDRRCSFDFNLFLGSFTLLDDSSV